MYFAGIMDHFSEAPKMELLVWGSTAGFFAFSGLQTRNQHAKARSKAGNVKAGSTGPGWTPLIIMGQISGLGLPPLIYWTVTAYNKFRQPEWLMEYALPSPPDVFGVDGVLVGRGVGLLALLAGMFLSHIAVKTMGDQFQGIGVSTCSPVLPATGSCPSRIADQRET